MEGKTVKIRYRQNSIILVSVILKANLFKSSSDILDSFGIGNRTGIRVSNVPLWIKHLGLQNRREMLVLSFTFYHFILFFYSEKRIDSYWGKSAYHYSTRGFTGEVFIFFIFFIRKRGRVCMEKQHYDKLRCHDSL